MSWWASIGVGIVTAFVGGVAWTWLVVSYFSSKGAISTGEDRALLGFFAFVLASGVGFIVGIAVSRIHGVTPRHSLGFSAVYSVALPAALVLLGVLLRPGPPRIHGEKLVLQMEVTFPRAWTPAQVHDPEKSACWLSAAGDRQRGIVEWKKAAQREDGRWTMPLWFALRSPETSQEAWVSLGDGPVTQPALGLSLPKEFAARDELWSPWISSRSPDANVEEFRFRVQRQSEVSAAERALQKADIESTLRQREQLFDSLGPESSLEDWLGLFEPDPDLPPYEKLPKAIEAIQTKLPEFAAVLQSPDRALVRRGVIALKTVPKIPVDLTPALVQAGRQVSSDIGSARSTLNDNGNPWTQKVTWQYFESWNQAIDHGTSVDKATYLAVLEEMANQVKSPRVEFDFHVRYVVRQRIAACKRWK